MKTFYSNGKLLLTGEYIVLDGANALALPTKYGQSLTIEVLNAPELKWRSIDEKGHLWFEGSFQFNEGENRLETNSNDAIASRLLQILNTVNKLKPNFLNSIFSNTLGLLVTSKLDFNKNWGLGSSSTLLNNIAQWAKIDAFELSRNTFGGSGYDIACAQNNSPIIYSLTKRNHNITRINFDPSFKSQLFFVHLNQKQNSRDSISTYENNKTNISAHLAEINTITNSLINSKTLSEFENLLTKHESIIGDITNQEPIKKQLFKDFNHAIKSLGGWGGDFILVTGNASYVKHYFEEKGYHTIISFEAMIL